MNPVILVVDDNLEIQNFLKTLLRDNHFSVFAVETRVKAIDSLEKVNNLTGLKAGASCMMAKSHQYLLHAGS